MSTFAVSSEKLRKLPVYIISEVSGPIAIKLAKNVAKISPFNACKSELRYWNPFRNASVLNKVPLANFAQNRLPRQRPVRNRKKVRINKAQANTFHLVKRS